MAGGRDISSASLLAAPRPRNPMSIVNLVHTPSLFPKLKEEPGELSSSLSSIGHSIKSDSSSSALSPASGVGVVVDSLLSLHVTSPDAGNSRLQLQDTTGAPKDVDVRMRQYNCCFKDPETHAKCSSVFKSKTDLARHKRYIHGRREAELMSRHLLLLHEGKVIKTAAQLEWHTSRNLLACDICGQAFVSGRVDSVARHKAGGACRRRGGLIAPVQSRQL